MTTRRRRGGETGLQTKRLEEMATDALLYINCWLKRGAKSACDSPCAHLETQGWRSARAHLGTRERLSRFNQSEPGPSIHLEMQAGTNRAPGQREGAGDPLYGVRSAVLLLRPFSQL